MRSKLFVCLSLCVSFVICHFLYSVCVENILKWLFDSGYGVLSWFGVFEIEAVKFLMARYLVMF